MTLAASQGLQITQPLAAKLLAALVNAAPAAILDVTSTVRLFKAGPAPTFTEVLTDYTESGYTGYATQTLTGMSAAFNVPGGQAVEKQFIFQVTTSGPAENALGYLIVAADGLTLLGGELFPTPIPMTKKGDSVVLSLLLAPKSLWGGQLQG